ncbi:MAG: type II secretion system minor pseudopilin GspK [Gammaproteobacteria bacterium]|nr:type II secretion system minor pseudopilin GspK [Gammaproteobacteria bacterium]
MIRSKHKRQNGIAAITALLVVALATLLAANLAWQLTIDMRRTEAQFLRAQSIQFAIGAELMAAHFLREDFEDDQENEEFCDHPDEDWAQTLTLPFEAGTIQGKLTDLQTRFNLNSLLINGEKNTETVEYFGRLLERLELDPSLGAKIIDWIDPDQTEEFGGAEDGTYTSFTPGYRAANTWMTTPTELLAIDGFVAQENEEASLAYQTLRQAVTALPSFSQKINVNAAPDAVLLAIPKNGGAQDADELRQNYPYCQLLSGEQGDGAFLDLPGGIEVDPVFANQYLDVSSSFFQLKVTVTLGTNQFTMYSLLYRDPTDGWVTTKLRYFDTE